jgi:hypothetical protein
MILNSFDFIIYQVLISHDGDLMPNKNQAEKFKSSPERLLYLVKDS